jgi:hypothetical protein
VLLQQRQQQQQQRLRQQLKQPKMVRYFLFSNEYEDTILETKVH